MPNKKINNNQVGELENLRNQVMGEIHNTNQNSDLSSVEIEIKKGSQIQPYNEFQRELAKRQAIVNSMIKELTAPLVDEQESKNKYRKGVLIGFAVYFCGITIAVFWLLFNLSADGYSVSETKVANILITGLFINVVGLAIIIFKYLFDEKNSVFKELIKLFSKSMEFNPPKDEN